MNILYICRSESLKCWGNRDSSLDWLAERVLGRTGAYLQLQVMNILRLITYGISLNHFIIQLMHTT